MYMKIQKKALAIFFPAMYLCAFVALIAIWGSEVLPENFFKLIPTFFVIGFAAFITWVISTIIEFKNIAKAK
jgi:hypothetical protein